MPEGILPVHSFSVQLNRFPSYKHNAQSCHAGVWRLQSYQEFGEISDYLPWTPSVHSYGKMSPSKASNMSKKKGGKLQYFFSRYASALF